MDDELKEAITATDTWIRALFMVLFALIYSVAEFVLVVVVIVQFFFVLLTRERNQRLLEFGEDLGVFIFQIIQYVTFNSEEKPFPFAPWPYGADDEGRERELDLDDPGDIEDDDVFGDDDDAGQSPP